MTQEDFEPASPLPLRRFALASYWREALVLGLVLIVALADLTAPGLGDQALYLTYAKKMLAGAALYRDVWDIKQPGIFFFYVAALRLFGPYDFSVHALEILWMLALAVALQIGLRPYFSHRWTRALVALPTVGLYYAVSAPFLGQVEGLVALPLFLTLWALNVAARSPRFNRHLFFWGGVAGGIVLCFKLVYVIIVAALFLTAASEIFSRGGRARLSTIAASLGAFALGAFVPLLVVTLMVVRGSGFETLITTTFVDPGRIAHEHPGAPLSRFLQSAGYFVKIFAPIIILAVAGGGVALYRRDRFLARLLVVWLLAAVAGIVVQTWSWWQHHFLLLWLPIGIFATKAIDVALDWAARPSVPRDRTSRRTLAALGFALLFLPAAVQPATNVYLMVRTKQAPLTESGRIAFQTRRSALYRYIYESTAFLRDPRSKQGPIFVCGSPINYVLAKRDQALRADGYSLDIQLPEQWRQFTGEFERARPVYVYVESECGPLLAANSPGTMEILRDSYSVHRQSAGGTWYERR